MTTETPELTDATVRAFFESWDRDRKTIARINELNAALTNDVNKAHAVIAEQNRTIQEKNDELAVVIRAKDHALGEAGEAKGELAALRRSLSQHVIPSVTETLTEDREFTYEPRDRGDRRAPRQ